VNDCIDSTESFNIYITSLGIPLNFIGCYDGTANKSLNCVAFALEVTDKSCSDKS
jgi:hypothetical protein